MATNKALREAPQKYLDKYVASIRLLNGAAPKSVPDTSFLSSKYVVDGTDISIAAPSIATSDIDIGFKLTLNGITYTKITIGNSGWAALQDPTCAVFNYLQIYSADSYLNNTIRNQFTTYDHVLLAPWNDALYPVAASPDTLYADATYNGGATIDSQTLQNIKNASSTVAWPYDLTDRGVRYTSVYDGKKGKGFLIRWSMVNDYFYYFLKFEVVIYESGRIEYRYWPLKYTYAAGTSVSIDGVDATCGIFWSGASIGQNKFRDFAPMLNYEVDQRKIYNFGGAAYDSGYTDGGKPYSVALGAVNWPVGGAIITFSPPVNPLRILPRKIVKDIFNTREIVSRPGLFDDRRTVGFFTSSIVHMPSTLQSRLQGDTGNIDISLRQLLFTNGTASGSLEVINGKVSKSAIDQQLAQLQAIEKLDAVADYSFNESQKNLSSTSSTSSFYTTGSALETFGPGFTSPLKSKTQFNLSLPVTKQTTLLAATASMCYYDNSLTQWTMVNSSELSNPSKVFSEPDDSLSAYEFGVSANPIYRVVETSRCFDAVGRKIVSGSNATDSTALSGRTQQSDDAIGAVFNNIGMDAIASSTTALINPEEANTAHTRTYTKSLFEYTQYHPSNTQKISVPTQYPFLLEKIVVKFPLYINGGWFDDLTTCVRPFTDSTDIFASANMSGRFRGAIDFGGPGITFGVFCHRSGTISSYMDLIASGTITNYKDNSAGVVLKKDPNMKFYSMRPVGFKSFSNPTTVISGTNNIFDGAVQMELESSVAGGMTFARLDRSYVTSSYLSPTVVSSTLVDSNRSKAVFLLTSPQLQTRGERGLNTFDMRDNSGASAGDETKYDQRSPRVYIQQVSPLSRGSTGVQFNGNSILGGNIAYFNLEDYVTNPLYTAASSSLSSELKSKIDTNDFAFEAVSVYSTVDSRPAPYLLMPGDKLTLSISKTRPIIYRARFADTSGGFYNQFSSFDLSGSHGTVMLNTGSINITLYGSYVREGEEYNP